MTDNLKTNFEDIDKDLSKSWIDLSDQVRTLAADLKLKAAGTGIGADAAHLSQQVNRLADHVEKLHTDMIDLMENIEERIPAKHFAETDGAVVNPNEVDREKIQVQRERHELRSDLKDILKALFMWQDDPVERVKGKQ
ncbi:hypothetical protein ACFSSA_13115 [Luteolibacter algae]|uniref:Uncharacterized protein n=1 Tax=Luteolibacter algae TaxID=454151 RepID=A0ABW5DD86_9BACT